MPKGGNGGGNGGGGNGGGGGGGGAPKGTRKDDDLVGTSGDDIIDAGRGNDTVDGAAGDDFITGDEGNDTLYGNTGNDRLFGGSGDDVLSGGDGHDELFGGLGDDVVMGDAGDDHLQGNIGSDILDGGAGYDIASFADVGGGIDDIGVTLTASFDGTSTTYTATNLYSSTRTDTDILTGIEEVRGTDWDDHMTGAGGNDYFVGAGGNDTLDGAGGDDILYGSVEDDLLTGGAGADQFVFLRRADGKTEAGPDDPPGFDPADPGFGDGNDVITDFDASADQIVFLSNETTEIAVTNDGTDTTISYGTASTVVLAGQVLTEAEIDVLFVVDADYDFVF